MHPQTLERSDRFIWDKAATLHRDAGLLCRVRCSRIRSGYFNHLMISRVIEAGSKLPKFYLPFPTSKYDMVQTSHLTIFDYVVKLVDNHHLEFLLNYLDCQPFKGRKLPGRSSSAKQSAVVPSVFKSLWQNYRPSQWLYPK